MNPSIETINNTPYVSSEGSSAVSIINIYRKPDNGLAPIRWQTIIWSFDVLDASLSLDEWIYTYIWLNLSSTFKADLSHQLEAGCHAYFVMELNSNFKGFLNGAPCVYLTRFHDWSHVNRFMEMKWGIDRMARMEWQHHDDIIKWKHFPRYCPFVRGIHRSRWCFLWSASEQTVE